MEPMLGGSIELVAQTYRIQLLLIQVAGTSDSAKRVSRKYKGGELGLTREMRIAVRMLTRDLLVERSGTLRIR